jgi:hypothetical protein
MEIKRVNGVYVVSTGRTEQPYLCETLDEALEYADQFTASVLPEDDAELD